MCVYTQVCVCVHITMAWTGQDWSIANLGSDFPGWPCKASGSSFQKLWAPQVKDHTLYFHLTGLYFTYIYYIIYNCIWRSVPEHACQAEKKRDELRGSAWGTSEPAGGCTGDSSARFQQMCFSPQCLNVISSKKKPENSTACCISVKWEQHSPKQALFQRLLNKYAQLF